MTARVAPHRGPAQARLATHVAPPPSDSAILPPLHLLDENVQRLIRYKARRMVGKAGLTSSDVDDIAQDICLDLLSRWPTYRPERAQSSTFIARLVEHKLATILRHRRSQNGTPTVVPH